MKLAYRTRRCLALLLVTVGLPVYVVAAVSVINLIERPPVFVELAVYVAAGIAWALPFRFVFRGIARPESDE
ncbi:MAG: DUF2842 domain-containing protein [Paracoccaceae bacterium]|nr:DUF2842 domain-containing protein [Paracoccaceae bacterium]